MKSSDPVSCQNCREGAVRSFLSLGNQPACHLLADATEAAQEPSWPLDLGFCPRCSLVQVMEPVDERILFADGYHHLAGLTQGFRKHLAVLADELATTLESQSRKRYAVEIGSNDGTLLDLLAERGFEVLGIDPCGSESPGGSPVVREYFGADVAQRLRTTTRPADVVLATNTLAHVTNLHDFLEGVHAMLADDGMFVSESHYLPGLLEDLQYDFIYHEHSRYYSVTALAAAFERHGLEIFSVQQIATHGGSIRVYAGLVGAHEVQESVAAIRAEEDAMRLTDEATYAGFATRVEQHREQLLQLLKEVSADGSRVAAASLPARAVTLLNYVPLGPDELDYIAEISPKKIGLLSPGTHLPVVAQSQLCGPDQPEYALLLSWHILDELTSRLRAEGFTGKFIVPLPEPRIID